jgi:hypothetical protein
MSTWFIPVLYVGTFGVLFGALYAWVWRLRRQRKRSPLTRGLLRPPGYSLREKREDLLGEAAILLGTVPAIPIYLYAAYLTHWVNRGAAPGAVALAIYVFFASVVVVVGAILIVRKFALAHRLRVGLEAELAAGEELNQLAHDGYWVFHDLPAEGFNIDHVVVGRTGVYAVETKGRPKSTGDSSEKGWEVAYDGKSLQFPDWQTSEPLEQAERQATWLRKWLSSAVGEQVPVRPVLILPGWYIRRTAGGGMPVFNGKEVRAYLPKVRAGDLSEILVERIRHQLDQRCRSVEPTKYGRQREKSLQA